MVNAFLPRTLQVHNNISLGYSSFQVFAEYKLFPQPCSQDWDMKDGGSVNKASTSHGKAGL